MKILVTGSEGNIGSKLIPHLKKCGHEIYCVDIKQKFDHNYILSDITNPIDIIDVFDKFKPEVVYHLAAMVSRITCEKSPSLCVNTNITGTNNIIQLCKKHNSKIIYFSTSEIYGNISGILSEDRTDVEPNNLYGLTKYLGEKLIEYEVKNNKLKAIIVRPFMFYDADESMGEHRSAMIRFAENLVKRQKIIVHKNSERSWMHINDAIIVLEKLVYVNEFKIINIGNEQVIKMETLARKMCDYLGLKYKDYVIENELPDKMTLVKYPMLKNQNELTGHVNVIDIDNGIREIIEIVKKRINK
jgi:nucleoside-diphosphate-sugar epimerase